MNHCPLSLARRCLAGAQAAKRDAGAKRGVLKAAGNASGTGRGAEEEAMSSCMDDACMGLWDGAECATAGTRRAHWGVVIDHMIGPCIRETTTRLLRQWPNDKPRRQQPCLSAVKLSSYCVRAPRCGLLDRAHSRNHGCLGRDEARLDFFGPERTSFARPPSRGSLSSAAYLF